MNRKWRRELAAAEETNHLLTRSVDRLNKKNAKLLKKTAFLEKKNAEAMAENQQVKEALVEKEEALEKTELSEYLLKMEKDNLVYENEKQMKNNEWLVNEMKKTGDNIQISLDLNWGKTFSLEINQHETVENAKIMLHEKTDVCRKMQRWIFYGKQLENHRTLSFYCIHNGSSLGVILRRVSGRHVCDFCKPK